MRPIACVDTGHTGRPGDLGGRGQGAAGGAEVAEGVGGSLGVDVVDGGVGAGYGDCIVAGLVCEVDDGRTGRTAGRGCGGQAEDEGSRSGEDGELHLGDGWSFEIDAKNQ